MKRSVWQSPDQERTNQNARIYLKTALPYNKLYILHATSYSLLQCNLLHTCYIRTTYYTILDILYFIKYTTHHRLHSTYFIFCVHTLHTYTTYNLLHAATYYIPCTLCYITYIALCSLITAESTNKLTDVRYTSSF